jgi:hypothetical protein
MHNLTFDSTISCLYFHVSKLINLDCQNTKTQTAVQ